MHQIIASSEQASRRPGAELDEDLVLPVRDQTNLHRRSASGLGVQAVFPQLGNLG